MVAIKKMKRILDNVVDSIGGIFLACMTIIITFQICSRYFFSYTPRWSEEVTLLMLIWVAFLGIAVGFREKLHIGVGFFVGLFPKKTQKYFDLFSKILLIIVSLVFIYYGIRFSILMSGSTMAGTGMPQTVLYLSIPVCGVLMLIYGIELLFKEGMHQEWDETDEVEDMRKLMKEEGDEV